MMLTRRHLLAGSFGLLAGTAFPALARDLVRVSGRAFGTSWQVTLPAGPDPAALGRELGAVLARIDAAMSPFRPDTEISRFNALDSTGQYAVGGEFAGVTAEALRIAALTNGAFDPSVGPDVGRYGFGPIGGHRSGDYRAFTVVADALAKAERSLTLDLCGIAKGYGLDCMAVTVEDWGARDFVIEIGGEVLARGRAPHGTLWPIGIEHPVAGGLFATVDPGPLAVATSGDRVHAFEVAGRRYCHIIDPATDEPVSNRVASVTVLAPSAMTADGLATALMVMGPQQGLAFADAHGLPVLYLLHAPGGVEAMGNARFDRLRLG